MSLLTDYEELSQNQELGIFKEVLDETLKPILIMLDERYFKTNMMVNELKDKIEDLKDEMKGRIDGWDTKVEHDLTDAYEVHNTKLRNIWSDVLKLQSDMESIKLNLKK